MSTRSDAPTQDAEGTATAAVPPAEPVVPAFQNPYEGHRALSSSEQELLGEYARLAATVHRVAALSVQLSNSTHHANTLRDLRAIERKMGLVLTLFKASVWAIVMQQTDMEEAEMDEHVGAPFEPLMETSEEAWDDSQLQASGHGDEA
ncbi:hypothetical protein MCAP1_001680 [Malassezia caprae]|uniref:DASH complex subunit DAD3 n=1 Tax=Malassezia caprae TaxID=1381934 RepID=A0AAF0IZX2_9BASI|nr:hypothetical protein MCAP1_001680 [Malassezia caprae]